MSFLPSGASSSGLTSWSHHPKIAKTALGNWQVTHHLVGPRTFKKWEAARDYALSEISLEWTPGDCPNARGRTGVIACNCVGLCHPRRMWVLK